MDGIYDLKRARFIHCAIPDVNLSEIKTTEKLRVDGKPAEVIPVAVEVESDNDALRFDGERILFFIKKRRAFFLLEQMHLHTVEGINAYVQVADGHDLAKFIRMGGDVGVVRVKDPWEVKQIVEQLRIAMFLTNSADLDALRKAQMVML